MLSFKSIPSEKRPVESRQSSAKKAEESGKNRRQSLMKITAPSSKRKTFLNRVETKWPVHEAQDDSIQEVVVQEVDDRTLLAGRPSLQSRPPPAQTLAAFLTS